MKPARLFFLLAAILLGGCVSLPPGISAVDGFSLPRYLGTWYEIARLDHPFERGLSRVTAEYTLREDGGVRVVNRGYDAEKGRWKEAIGRAYLVAGPTSGQLKVSFFGPFYASYNIIALDRESYRWALVCGPSRDYLWILAREPHLDIAILSRLIARSAELGFATEQLLLVDQE